MPPNATRTSATIAPQPAVGQAWGPVGLRVALLVVSIAGAAVLLAASLTPTVSLADGLLDVVDDRLIGGIPPLPEDLGQAAERSVVYDRNGNEIAVLRAENRRRVGLEEIPVHVQQAVIATEDAQFSEHRGVNWRAIARAVAGNVTAGDITSGASTITQQLVKNRVVGTEQTVDRKLREAVYAIELERRFSKEEILQAYLNEVYLANGVYGIGTAAEYYWGKEPSELTVADGALLAGMIRSPHRNDPLADPLAALRRRNIVIGQMVEERHLEPSAAEELKSAPLDLDIHPLPEARNPYVIDYVRAMLRADPALGADEVERDQRVLLGGLEIHTTIDPRLQEIAHSVIGEVLSGSDAPLGALTAVDPRSGELLAIGFGPHPYGSGPGQVDVNPAVPGLGSPGRPSGSAFKPFGIVAALEEGVSPTLVFNSQARYQATNPVCQGWAPGNYADASLGRLDMAAATARSSNTYFAHLVDQLAGPDKLVDVATRMGITTPLEPFCSIVLGTADVYPLDMASAFGTLANGGEHCPPFVVARVVGPEGRRISGGDQGCARAIDPGIAARTTALLRGPIETGTASARGRIGRAAAGKTGTTDESRDAWFVGYIPQLSAAAWVGHDQQRTLTDPRCGGQVTGGCLPTMIWQRFMTRAVDALGLPVEAFPAPPPLPVGPVPNVVGKQVAAAETELTDAGFASVTAIVEDYRPAGTVVAQDPGAAEQVELGSSVTLQVSDGEGSPPQVPDVVGLAVDQALAELALVELQATLVEVPADEDDVGVVVRQRPPPGTRADDLDSVTLEVGRERTASDPAPEPTVSPSPAAPPRPTPSQTPSQPRDGGGGGGGGPPGEGEPGEQASPLVPLRAG